MSGPAKPNNESLITSRSTQGSNNDSGKNLEHLDWINDQLTILAEAFGETLTEQRQEIYCAGLADIHRNNLQISFRRARYELKWFPKLAELREFAGFSPQSSSDGRPGVEEAWALCPKSEELSVVWTEEMAEAFEIARKLLNEGDEIAARMAFKEKYSAIVLSARLDSKPPRWLVSLGWDKADRVRALSEAVRKRQISPSHAYGLLAPESGEEFLLSLPVPERKLLVGDVKNDLSQLSGLPRVLAELAEVKALPKEVKDAPRSPHRTPSDRSPEEVSQLREKANAQVEFLKRSERAGGRAV
jgi:hypothetical protein